LAFQALLRQKAHKIHERKELPAGISVFTHATGLAAESPFLAAGKATFSSTLITMRIPLLILAFLLLIAVKNNQASGDLTSGLGATTRTCEISGKQREQELDRLERQKQLPAITATFARRTSMERAHRLAYLCYETTINTPFKPIDLAEIALAETGGHSLSPKAVSSRGAVGVWQLMPERAKSHGYAPGEMKHDDKCAAAAVRELKVKLTMADGDLALAKRLYCGIGKQARLYEAKIRKYRREIMGLMHGEPLPLAGDVTATNS